MSQVTTTVVDREAEAELLEAALRSGAHVLLEGPPGTGKSTLLRRVAATRHIPFVMVEGNAELTPARLIGHFDPALVLSKGYVAEIFADGPLLEAMRTGGLLYVEELNRIPEETLNVLLTAMSELEITVPRLGRVTAVPGFALVAAMNPFDAVGTARVSSALYDRTCRISMDYQTATAEEAIVATRTDDLDPAWRARVVDLVRRTRSHDDVRFGSSVRGAIDVARLSVELAGLRGVTTDDWHVGLAAAQASLSGRIRLQDGCDRRPEDVVTEIYVAVFGAEPDDPSDTSSDHRDEGPPGER
ncbi:MoxR family ATPase [Nocardioides sp. C4-1]|uniref:AAA family ATPase n=1 Tax=Nocardioides sp. C4-1 TaxID=3151851 RepID=UPI003266112D